MVLYFGNKNDNKKSGSGNPDEMFGRGGNDTLKGLGSNDLLVGESGNDVLKGGASGDVLDGGSGRDKLYGGGGDDQLFGLRGNDKIWGNSGDDSYYYYASNFGKDSLMDFTAGEGSPDSIVFITSIFADFNAVMNATADVNGNAVITLNANNKIKIVDVVKADLHEDDFFFAT